tara:strand:- start:85 stop:468 length:384 start_codon:yes stop_codon:yes gene_type:complete
MDKPLTDEEFLEEFFKHPSINIQGENSRFSPEEWAKMERIRDVALAVHFDQPLRLFNTLDKDQTRTVSINELLGSLPNWRTFNPTIVITTIVITYAHMVFPEWVHYANDIASDKFYGDDPESYRIAS